MARNALNGLLGIAMMFFGAGCVTDRDHVFKSSFDIY